MSSTQEALVVKCNVEPLICMENTLFGNAYTCIFSLNDIDYTPNPFMI